MKNFLILCALAAAFSSCRNAESESLASASGSGFCSVDCMAKSKSGELACKKTSLELQQYKETVVANLKSKLQDKKELADGYAFKFSGSDQMVDDLTAFIKTERACCEFFTFKLSVSGDQSEAWLHLTGPEGTKDFIARELGL